MRFFDNQKESVQPASSKKRLKGDQDATSQLEKPLKRQKIAGDQIEQSEVLKSLFTKPTDASLQPSEGNNSSFMTRCAKMGLRWRVQL